MRDVVGAPQDAGNRAPDGMTAGDTGTMDELRPATVRLYELLLRKPRSTAGELARHSDLDASETGRHLEILRRAELAVPIVAAEGTLWEPGRPRDPMEELLRREQGHLQMLRDHHRTLRQLSELYRLRERHDSYPGIEVLRDQELVHQQLQRLQREAHGEVLALDRRPYHSDGHPQRRADQVAVQARALARGVSYRVIYESALWDRHEHAVVALDGINRGEKARVMPTLPLKMFVVDGERALIPLDPANHADSSTLLIYPSGLLRALVDLFEQFWTSATPVGAEEASVTQGELSPRDRSILTLLSAGATDELIARRLKVSRSTVTRAVADIQRRLDADTRFQAGASAARRGWI